jgi:hypothetical protein
MFESLASCFAFRCSASLNMTVRLRALPAAHSFAQNCFLMRRFETVQKRAIDKIVCHAPHATESKASTFFGSQR